MEYIYCWSFLPPNNPSVMPCTSHRSRRYRCAEVLMDAVHVSFDFSKVLIPISIAMKILLSWTGSAICPASRARHH